MPTRETVKIISSPPPVVSVSVSARGKSFPKLIRTNKRASKSPSALSTSATEDYLAAKANALNEAQEAANVDVARLDASAGGKQSKNEKNPATPKHNKKTKHVTNYLTLTAEDDTKAVASMMANKKPKTEKEKAESSPKKPKPKKRAASSSVMKRKLTETKAGRPKAKEQTTKNTKKMSLSSAKANKNDTTEKSLPGANPTKKELAKKNHNAPPCKKVLYQVEGCANLNVPVPVFWGNNEHEHLDDRRGLAMDEGAGTVAVAGSSGPSSTSGPSSAKVLSTTTNTAERAGDTTNSGSSSNNNHLLLCSAAELAREVLKSDLKNNTTNTTRQSARGDANCSENNCPSLSSEPHRLPKIFPVGTMITATNNDNDNQDDYHPDTSYYSSDEEHELGALIYESSRTAMVRKSNAVKETKIANASSATNTSSCSAEDTLRFERAVRAVRGANNNDHNRVLARSLFGGPPAHEEEKYPLSPYAAQFVPPTAQSPNNYPPHSTADNDSDRILKTDFENNLKIIRGESESYRHASRSDGSKVSPREGFRALTRHHHASIARLTPTQLANVVSLGSTLPPQSNLNSPLGIARRQTDTLPLGSVALPLGALPLNGNGPLNGSNGADQTGMCSWSEASALADKLLPQLLAAVKSPANYQNQNKHDGTMANAKIQARALADRVAQSLLPQLLAGANLDPATTYQNDRGGGAITNPEMPPAHDRDFPLSQKEKMTPDFRDVHSKPWNNGANAPSEDNNEFQVSAKEKTMLHSGVEATTKVSPEGIGDPAESLTESYLAEAQSRLLHVAGASEEEVAMDEKASSAGAASTEKKKKKKRMGATDAAVTEGQKSPIDVDEEAPADEAIETEKKRPPQGGESTVQMDKKALAKGTATKEKEKKKKGPPENVELKWIKQFRAQQLTEGHKDPFDTKASAEATKMMNKKKKKKPPENAETKWIKQFRAFRAQQLIEMRKEAGSEEAVETKRKKDSSIDAEALAEATEAKKRRAELTYIKEFRAQGIIEMQKVQMDRQALTVEATETNEKEKKKKKGPPENAEVKWIRQFKAFRAQRMTEMQTDEMDEKASSAKATKMKSEKEPSIDAEASAEATEAKKGPPQDGDLTWIKELRAQRMIAMQKVQMDKQALVETETKRKKKGPPIGAEFKWLMEFRAQRLAEMQKDQIDTKALAEATETKRKKDSSIDAAVESQEGSMTVKKQPVEGAGGAEKEIRKKDSSVDAEASTEAIETKKLPPQVGESKSCTTKAQEVQIPTSAPTSTSSPENQNKTTTVNGKPISLKKKRKSCKYKENTNVLRPFNRYNIYFILERENILKSLGGKSDVGAVHPVHAEDAIETGYENLTFPPLPPRFADVKMDDGWYIPGKTKRKRPHRKTHGVTSFSELAKGIAVSWKTIDVETLGWCHAAEKILKDRQMLLKAKERTTKAAGNQLKVKAMLDLAKKRQTKTVEDKSKAKSMLDLARKKKAEDKLKAKLAKERKAKIVEDKLKAKSMIDLAKRKQQAVTAKKADLEHSAIPHVSQEKEALIPKNKVAAANLDCPKHLPTPTTNGVSVPQARKVPEQYDQTVQVTAARSTNLPHHPIPATNIVSISQKMDPSMLKDDTIMATGKRSAPSSLTKLTIEANCAIPDVTKSTCQEADHENTLQTWLPNSAKQVDDLLAKGRDYIPPLISCALKKRKLNHHEVFPNRWYEDLAENVTNGKHSLVDGIGSNAHADVRVQAKPSSVPLSVSCTPSCLIKSSRL